MSKSSATDFAEDFTAYGDAVDARCRAPLPPNLARDGQVVRFVGVDQFFAFQHRHHVESRRRFQPDDAFDQAALAARANVDRCRLGHPEAIPLRQ